MSVICPKLNHSPTPNQTRPSSRYFFFSCFVLYSWFSRYPDSKTQKQHLIVPSPWPPNSLILWTCRLTIIFEIHCITFIHTASSIVYISYSLLKNMIFKFQGNYLIIKSFFTHLKRQLKTAS